MAGCEVTPKDQAYPRIVYQPGEPLVLRVLYEGRDYEFPIQPGSLAALCKQSADAMSWILPGADVVK